MEEARKREKKTNQLINEGLIGNVKKRDWNYTGRESEKGG